MVGDSSGVAYSRAPRIFVGGNQPLTNPTPHPDPNTPDQGFGLGLELGLVLTYHELLGDGTDQGFGLRLDVRFESLSGAKYLLKRVSIRCWKHQTVYRVY